MEYIIVALVCFVLGMLYSSGGKKPMKLDTQIMGLLKTGHRVMVIVDDEATIFEMHGDRIRITKALTSFNIEPMEDEGGVVPYDLVSGIANQPLDNRENSIRDETRD